MDENKLIEKLLKKDPVAVSWLVDAYTPGIYNVVFTYLQNKSDAEEICNDVFMAVLDSIHLFHRNSSLKTWMHRIAVNKSLDFLKYKNRKKRSGISFSLSDPERSAPVQALTDFRHPGLDMEDREMHDALFAAINRLPDNQKVALVQSCFEKQSHREIAGILGISEKSVESLLYRAKTNLRKLLEKICDDLTE